MIFVMQLEHEPRRPAWPDTNGLVTVAQVYPLFVDVLMLAAPLIRDAMSMWPDRTVELEAEG